MTLHFLVYFCYSNYCIDVSVQFFLSPVKFDKLELP